ncbi:Spop-1 protein [Aphelenchoides fujianensis]|nr:Spop-1 protein [Aphelenchoides fujianensis]
MAASRKRPLTVEIVHSVEYLGADVESEQIELPFRPGTKFSLLMTKPPDSLVMHVKIVIEGPVEGLDGAIWVENRERHSSIPRWNAQLNQNYSIALSLNDRVNCRVWIEEGSSCKEAKLKADHAKEVESLRSQLERSESRLAEQRLEAENTQKALASRIHQLEQGATNNERKLAAAADENAALQSTLRLLSDFRLVVDGQELPVHRAVLAEKSAFFETIFRENPQATEFVVDGFTRVIVERIVEYCYKGHVREMADYPVALYHAARHFQMVALEDACSEAICAGLTADRAAELLVAAARDDDSRLAKLAIDFAAETPDGKLDLLLSDPVQSLVPDELAAYKRIVEWMELKRTAERLGEGFQEFLTYALCQVHDISVVGFSSVHSCCFRHSGFDSE